MCILECIAKGLTKYQMFCSYGSGITACQTLAKNLHIFQLRFSMFSNFFIPELLSSGRNLSEEWFQQDGATCHTANETMALLKQNFGDKVISNPRWPPRSPDLTPPDFFLWGTLKGHVYSNDPQTVGALERNIRAAIEQ